MSDENFADLFAQTDGKRTKLPRIGDKVTGRLTSIGKKHAVIDLGGGTDGLVDMIAFAEGEGPVVGNTFTGVVVAVENRVVYIDRQIARGEHGMTVLEQAHRAKLPVEGVVSAVNKGGYIVEISGIRCFCPLGQMALSRIEDPNTMLGQRLQFLVSEVKEREAVLSRRQLLESEVAEQRKATLQTLAVGTRVRGTVRNVLDFGAFVDLGGIDGLVPASELAWGKVKPRDFLSPGQSVEVEVIALEGPQGAPERITLSMRALSDQPIKETTPAPLTGTVVEATVDRIESFGLFVTFTGGRGLLPKNELGEHEGDLRKKFPVGTVLQAAIVEVRPDGKIRLSKKAALESAERQDAEAFLGKQNQGGGFGTFAAKLQKAMEPKKK